MTRGSESKHAAPLSGHRPNDGREGELGLGIDAGGTYTDVVVFDFTHDTIVAKAKALTTKWNYTEGIEAALDTIPSRWLEHISLVSVSTTLATNAIVENHGQKVGALVMPPYGRFQDWELAHSPVAVVKGQMDMDGTVIAPIDPEEIEAVGRAMVRDHHVKAFAVSGSGATINASHEIEVMKILQAATGLGVTCGHTLSDMLGMYRRAATAIFNARVVPYIEDFLGNLNTALRNRSIDAPVMVVKGDGALMSAEMARERPVETIFSGPATSVAGARKLTNLPNALVVDIGGTTTDIAAIRNNRVEVCSSGNVVAGVHTHVRALNMRTKGLGGDSAISLKNRRLTIGPVRVTPVSLLASQYPVTRAALDFIENSVELQRMDAELIQVLALSKHDEPAPQDAVERETLALLAKRPYSIEEIARTLDLPYRGLATFSRLIRCNMVSVTALTPTDVLHAEKRIALWDDVAAQRFCGIYAAMMGLSYEAFASLALNTFTEELSLELFRKLMGGDLDSKPVDSTPGLKATLQKWLRPPQDDLSLSFRLPYPIIGVGAPAGEFVPAAARLFNTSCTMPKDYDVANAIGAITSAVSVTRTIKIAPKDNGRYAIWGLADGREFVDLKDAVECGRAQLMEETLNLAEKAGVLNPEIETIITDETVTDGYGVKMYLGTTVTASVVGRPATRTAED